MVSHSIELPSLYSEDRERKKERTRSLPHIKEYKVKILVITEEFLAII